MLPTLKQRIIDLYNLFCAKLLGAYKSATIWFNALMSAAIPALVYAQTQLPMLKDYLPDNFYGIAFVAVIVGNLLLRFKTTTGLENK